MEFKITRTFCIFFFYAGSSSNNNNNNNNNDHNNSQWGWKKYKNENERLKKKRQNAERSKLIQSFQRNISKRYEINGVRNETNIIYQQLIISLQFIDTCNKFSEWNPFKLISLCKFKERKNKTKASIILSLL